ncbi:MAG: hypothetical protein ACRDRQ_23300 [Pseudonocardiaceae bacterium]
MDERWVLTYSCDRQRSLVPVGVPGAGALPRRTSPRGPTSVVNRPLPLTQAQTNALRTVFAAQLQWPPPQPALSLQLKQGRSPSWRGD